MEPRVHRKERPNESSCRASAESPKDTVRARIITNALSLSRARAFRLAESPAVPSYAVAALAVMHVARGSFNLRFEKKKKKRRINGTKFCRK